MIYHHISTHQRTHTLSAGNMRLQSLRVLMVANESY